MAFFHQYTSAWLCDAQEKGKEEGRQAGIAEALAIVCAERNLGLICCTGRHCLSQCNTEQLTEWLRRAATAERTMDLFR